MGTPHCRIAHLSDIHAGCWAHRGIDEALISSVNGLDADLVVVTGDLVQRAHRLQYRRAAALLKALKSPQLVVPGNHDLYSWIYRPVLRVSVPLGRYKHYVTRDLSPSWEGRGVSVLGLNTATPWTIERGRCTPAHAVRLGAYFKGQPPGHVKVLAVHHPLTADGFPYKREIAQNASRLLSAAARAGVEIILCGHWHWSLVHEVACSDQRIVVALAGTAASRRYRAPQKGRNAFNVVELHAGAITVHEWRYNPAVYAFAIAQTHAFTRKAPQSAA